QVIDPQTQDPMLRALVETVHGMARQLGITSMPEVGVFAAPELNAFATGPSKSKSLVAVSSGMLQNMRAEEIRGVLGHEMTHIANGDMVTMTLLQGLVNAFVMFLARILGWVVANTIAGQRRDDRGGAAM